MRCLDMIWRVLSNNWYSIIVNGARYGFFHSTRGFKQGDPLSSTLFILGAKVLSVSLNALYLKHLYKGFQMEIRGPQINHLRYANNIIIFASTDRYSLQLIMNTHSTYKAMFDQLVNKEKSHFMVTTNTSQNTIELISNVTGFSKKDSPITYLGCPLNIGGQKIIYYSDLVHKIVKRISGWHAKIFTFGGKATLIKHVFLSTPIHTEF